MGDRGIGINTCSDDSNRVLTAEIGRRKQPNRREMMIISGEFGRSGLYLPEFCLLLHNGGGQTGK